MQRPPTTYRPISRQRTTFFRLYTSSHQRRNHQEIPFPQVQTRTTISSLMCSSPPKHQSAKPRPLTLLSSLYWLLEPLPRAPLHINKHHQCRATSITGKPHIRKKLGVIRSPQALSLRFPHGDQFHPRPPQTSPFKCAPQSASFLAPSSSAVRKTHT